MELDDLNKELLTCRRCPRLVAWREQVAREKRRAYRDEDYWGKPVPGFGDPHARIFVVGLAPGAHGSNRTGRQFTGDASGSFFYPALYRAGFASQPDSRSRDDGLTLSDLYTAPVCRCAPPENKPLPEEMNNCQPYLECELGIIKPKVIVALGQIAFDRILKIFNSGHWLTYGGESIKKLIFGHNLAYQHSSGFWLVCSYHPSQQNTLTGKLTKEMFDQVWEKSRKLLEHQ
jgi:uracil-DNA glycosylase